MSTCHSFAYVSRSIQILSLNTSRYASLARQVLFQFPSLDAFIAQYPMQTTADKLKALLDQQQGHMMQHISRSGLQTVTWRLSLASRWPAINIG